MLLLAFFIIITFLSLSVPGNGQSLDCDAFGGCFCSTDNRSDIYLHWIAPDPGNYFLICDPQSFGLSRQGKHAIQIKTDFNALVIIPLNKNPLNFKIEPETVGDEMTTVRCEDVNERPQENALVQKNSSNKKSPVIVEALTSDTSIDFHVFVVRYNKTLESWTQMPRSLCRSDIKNADFACLPVDCNNCDPTTSDPEKSDRIAECNSLKKKYWNES